MKFSECNWKRLALFLINIISFEWGVSCGAYSDEYVENPYQATQQVDIWYTHIPSRGPHPSVHVTGCLLYVIFITIAYQFISTFMPCTTSICWRLKGTNIRTVCYNTYRDARLIPLVICIEGKEVWTVLDQCRLIVVQWNSSIRLFWHPSCYLIDLFFNIRRKIQYSPHRGRRWRIIWSTTSFVCLTRWLHVRALNLLTFSTFTRVFRNILLA